MLSVYNYMASGVLLTGIVALVLRLGSADARRRCSAAPGIAEVVIMLAPLGVRVRDELRRQTQLSTSTLKAMFWGFAVAMGLSMSTIFLRLTGASIAVTFFATAAAFAGLSLYGYTTKRDLSAFGTFLIMGVVGLIVASLLNLFLQSSGSAW